MKPKSNFLIGLFIGALLSGALSFLFLPLFSTNPSFLSGFIACAVFALCLCTSALIWNRKFSNANTFPRHRQTIQMTAITFTGLLLVLLTVMLNERMFRQDSWRRMNAAKQTELIETTRNSGLLSWMSELLKRADAELKENTNRQLSDETIAAIAAVSYSFKPYPRLEADSATIKLISPERGMLLMALTRMQMDSSSTQKIMVQSHFAHADLRDADLRGVNLGRVDLDNADLRGANLENANLKHANLNSANLWSANLRNANLNEADLKRAELSWADLSGAQLIRADLHEASLISAQLRNANLQNAILKWTDFTGAFLNEADLSDTDLFRATLIRAQLDQTNFTNASLSLAILSEARLNKTSFTGSDLSGTYIDDPQWLVRLTQWHVPDASIIQQAYTIADGVLFDVPSYQLKKNNE